MTTTANLTVYSQTQDGKFADAREHYDYLQHRVCVHFEPKNSNDSPSSRFELVLNKRLNYAQLSQKVGEHLNVDPTHIRFSPVNVGNGKPKAPIKYSTAYNLGQMLSQGYSMYGAPSQRTDSLFYEVLECSMQELESRKFIKVTFLPETDAHDKEVCLHLGR
jgi:ubiquitin carboxyl-terminal hydrolase 7